MAAGLINIVLLIYLIKTKQKSIYTKQIILGIIQGILYLPWLIYFASQLKTMHDNSFWISLNKDTIYEIFGYMYAGSLKKIIGFIISIPIYGYLIYLIIKKKKENSKPALYGLLIYILVILAALIMSLILKTPILYYRYMLVVTGLMIFALSYMYEKSDNKKIVYAILTGILIVSIISNTKMIKNNYNQENQAPIEYVKENLKENDVIVYPKIGVGSIFAVNFPDQKQYFYNGENWGVEEAYKAFGPGMKTYITTDFLQDEECQNRIWIISSSDYDEFYEENFNNENYKLIENKTFYTNYSGKEEYKIYLIEKNK